MSRFGQRLLNQESSLDIKTEIETFHSWVLISRLESRLLKFESWYRDWNKDSEILSLDIETGIETKKQRGTPVIETLAGVTAHLWYRVPQWHSDSVTQWLSDSVTQFFSASVTQWLSDSVTQWLSYSVTQWLGDLVTQWLSDSVTQWISESMAQWLRDLMTWLRILY